MALMKATASLAQSALSSALRSAASLVAWKEYSASINATTRNIRTTRITDPIGIIIDMSATVITTDQAEHRLRACSPI